jgi:uncharacterized ferritin-like protein (DUF455 family)
MNILESASGVPHELRQLALYWVGQTDAAAKAEGVMGLAKFWHAGQLSLDADVALQAQVAIPGRPALPELISPKFVKHRSMRTTEGRAALIHALTHIEFNAINLALDAIWRFGGMPTAYYVDWLQVTGEEALHFSLLAAHLQVLGHRYGDFPAHNSMWEMADKTSADILARMALVPRTLEARGLDATPLTRAKLAQAGDQAAAEILDIILRDEHLFCADLSIWKRAGRRVSAHLSWTRCKVKYARFWPYPLFAIVCICYTLLLHKMET